MSSDVVREIHGAVERGDLQAFAEKLHPDAVWEHNPGGGSPEEGTYEGRTQIKQLFERILEGWDYMRPVVAEIRNGDGGVYQVRGELHCKHPTSETEIVVPYEQHLEFDGGLLSKGRMVFGS